jgi:hypothetical protein
MHGAGKVLRGFKVTLNKRLVDDHFVRLRIERLIAKHTRVKSRFNWPCSQQVCVSAISQTEPSTAGCIDGGCMWTGRAGT